jgi:hypothetical protein
MVRSPSTRVHSRGGERERDRRSHHSPNVRGSRARRRGAGRRQARKRRGRRLSPHSDSWSRTRAPRWWRWPSTRGTPSAGRGRSRIGDPRLGYDGSIRCPDGCAGLTTGVGFKRSSVRGVMLVSFEAGLEPATPGLNAQCPTIGRLAHVSTTMRTLGAAPRSRTRLACGHPRIPPQLDEREGSVDAGGCLPNQGSGNTGPLERQNARVRVAGLDLCARVRNECLYRLAISP